MSNPLLKKNLVAGAAIAANRFVKFGVDDNTVVVAAAATDMIVGVSEETFDAATGERIDITKFGMQYVKLGAGGAVRGQPLTSDATGQAVVASVTGNRIGGYAEASGVAGDVIAVSIYFGVL
jgi:hypothetical protein